jgi:hypothetical protein
MQRSADRKVATVNSEALMRQILTGTFLALATMMLPALAQAPSTSAGQSPAPTAPNSGAGIPGQPGNKNGPAAKPPGSTGAVSSDQQGSAARNQDASNIPGQPGSKSGPAVAPPSSQSK